jgi:hypothetical protein
MPFRKFLSEFIAGIGSAEEKEHDSLDEVDKDANKKIVSVEIRFSFRLVFRLIVMVSDNNPPPPPALNGCVTKKKDSDASGCFKACK